MQGLKILVCTCGWSTHNLLTWRNPYHINIGTPTHIPNPSDPISDHLIFLHKVATLLLLPSPFDEAFLGWSRMRGVRLVPDPWYHERMGCNWYKKHARSLFTYDGPVDDAQYPLENCLGMVDLDLPNARGQYSLRDPGQARRLNTALDYTRPAPTPGAKKRTCGEVQLAAQDRHTREHRCTADEGVVRNAAIFNRGEGKRKSHAPGTVNV